MSEPKLIEAVKAGLSASIKELVESGEDVNQQDEYGWTPLNWAAGKGNLEIVKTLIGCGADAFKTGRDQRTPYMIANAAGHIEVMKFLLEAEAEIEGDKPQRPERKYCKAYHLRGFRKFSGWTESRINWKEPAVHHDVSSNGHAAEQAQSDDDIAFLQQDYTVTQSMWHNENVIFNNVTPEWKEFCDTVLNFQVPSDFDLVMSAKTTPQ